MRIPRPAAEKLGVDRQDPDLDGLLFGLIRRATGGCHEYAARASHPQVTGKGSEVTLSRFAVFFHCGASLKTAAGVVPEVNVTLQRQVHQGVRNMPSLSSPELTRANPPRPTELTRANPTHGTPEPPSTPAPVAVAV